MAALKIVCIGDSHTGSIQRPTYPEFLDELFGTTYDLVNKGMAGNTTADMVARFAADVIAEAPRYCFILGGYNDVNTGVANATIQANLRSMYDSCIANAITPFGINIFPFGGHAGWTSTKETNRQIINNYINQQFSSVPGSEVGVMNLNTPITTLINPANNVENINRPRLKVPFNTGDATDDGLHLNIPGARNIAGQIAVLFGFSWALHESGFTRNANNGLQVVPSAQVVHAYVPAWVGGFVRFPDGRLVVEEDAAGTAQRGFMRNASGHLSVTKVTTGATMQSGFLRSPPASGEPFGRLVVQTSAAGADWRDGHFRAANKALVVAGI